MDGTTTESIGLPSEEARRWATIAHLSALTGLLGNAIGFVLGPLFVWLIKRDVDPFVDAQGKEALNFQITMFLAAIGSAILIIVLIGFVLLLAVLLMMIIFPIIAAVKANRGEPYRYPMTIRLVK